MITFGPIPSRRLGRSLGINNIPPKVCSYSCVYCQAGITDTLSIERRSFLSTDAVYSEVAGKLDFLRAGDEQIDYITFVPDGEPTLDVNLGSTLRRLKPLGVKLAVITNATLLWDEGVRNDLYEADWVCVKVDSVREEIWKAVDRPHGKLSLEQIKTGIRKFASGYRGILATETMLVGGMNEDVAPITETAEFIGKLRPKKAYIMVPTRPPAERSVMPAGEEAVNAAYQIFGSFMENVELLICPEGTEFSCPGRADEELLGIVAVHPMRKDAVKRFLSRSNEEWNLVDGLIAAGQLSEVVYLGETFYTRRTRRFQSGKSNE